MRRKLINVGSLAVLFCVVSFFVNFWVGIVLTLLVSIFALLFISFIALNKLIRHTNWWNNQFVGIRQFVSNAGYRDNIIRNYDIVNLGSNPARFAFFYEGIKGQSWATGSQGQDMDYEILKYYHSYLKKGGTVLIPIMPFSAITPYLKERPEYWGVSYYSKFAQILDSTQAAELPYAPKVQKYLQYPLLVEKSSVLSLVLDSEPDNKFFIDYQPMMTLELQQDASNWIKMWLKEFRLKELDEVLSEKWAKYYRESVDIYKGIVSFCLERDLKPVFICVPMTKHLSDLFPGPFWDYMVTGFIDKVNEHDIPFLDYTNDPRFQEDNMYMNSYFLNMQGRKLFTHQVLIDLKVV